jgi:predicted nucleotidyltransferase component of viral defense system
VISDALRTYWSNKTGWLTDLQVEQDLWLHLLLVGIYNQPELSRELVFWGGTALHMLYLTDEDGHRMRYSEDLDFLRRSSGGIGPVLNPLATVIKDGGLDYSYQTRSPYPKAWARIPTTMREEPLKVKFEFNTWERDLALGTTAHRLVLSIPEELAVPGWSAGTVQIHTPQLDEQAAFKVRALWERDKGRDLFDLWAALTQGGGNAETIASLFYENYRKEGFDPAKLVDNLHNRLNTGSFESDLKPFVRTWPPYTYQPAVALDLIRETIISRLE